MNIFFCRDQIPTQGTKGARRERRFVKRRRGRRALRADRSRKYARKMNNAQRAALLFLGTDVLFHGFGGDGSGGFEGVSGLDAGGGGGDGSPSLAGRDTEGEGDQEERHDD